MIAESKLAKRRADLRRRARATVAGAARGRLGGRARGAGSRLRRWLDVLLAGPRAAAAMPDPGRRCPARCWLPPVDSPGRCGRRTRRSRPAAAAPRRPRRRRPWRSPPQSAARLGVARLDVGERAQAARAARSDSARKAARRACGGTTVSRRQAMHKSTAARSASRRGVNQRTLCEAQYRHCNMGCQLSTGRYVGAGQSDDPGASDPYKFLSKQMTCQPPRMLRFFCYRMMTNARERYNLRIRGSSAVSERKS